MIETIGCLVDDLSARPIGLPGGFVVLVRGVFFSSKASSPLQITMNNTADLLVKLLLTHN